MSTESSNAVSYTQVSPPRALVVPLRPLAVNVEAVARPETALPSTADDGAPLSQAIEELNRYVAGSRTDLRFAVDREAGELVVSIIDAESGEVLRQMPSVEALHLARYLEHDRLGLIRQRA